jgi:outer membrane protein
LRTGLLIAMLASSLCFAQVAIEAPEKPLTLLEALHSTLEKDPNVQLQQEQIAFNQGALRIASGQFDTLLTAGTQQERTVTPLSDSQKVSALLAGIPAANLFSNTASFSAGAQKEFRNGITIGPMVQVNRLSDNLQNRLGLDQASWSFQIQAPLLRGFGRSVVAAQESSDKITVQASVLDLNQSVAQELVAAAGNYWATVAAARDFEIARNSEERGSKYARDVQTLIDADRVPRGEINQLTANVANRTASRIAANRSLLAAQQTLGLAIGLTATELAIFPKPTDPLPDWPSDKIPALTARLTHDFIARALTRRSDLMAAAQRVRAAAVLIPAAKNQLRPQLNLSVNAGYSGLLEGTNYFRIFGSAFTNIGGPSASASLQFAFPVRNDSAFGAIGETNASYRQAVINQDNVARNIASNVVSSMVAFVDSIAELQKAKEAVRSFQLALNGEQEKFRMGLNSLVDVLTTEDRLIAALSTENSAHLDYANAIASLRFWTGTVVEPNATTHKLDAKTFSTPPFEWEQN